MLYGIIADIHSNLEAFGSVLSKISHVDQIICVGDIVGYGPNPNECIQIMQNKQILSVSGNHDKGAVQEYDINNFNENAKKAIKWTMEELTEGSKAYLRSLPLELQFDDFQLVHGSLSQPLEEYLYNLSNAKTTFELMKKPILFVGHTHVPMHLTYKGKIIINVGSVGQPRDGDPRASFGIYDSDKKKMFLQRVEYEILKVQEKMKGVCLPEDLINRLGFGR